MNRTILFGIVALLLGFAIFSFVKREDITQDTAKVTTNTPKEGTSKEISGSTSSDILKSLPEAPSGFSWYECKTFKGFVLKPDGWYTRDETKQDTQACFVTKEKIEPGKLFKTGLTINAIPNIPKKTGKKPSDYAEAFFATAGQGLQTSELKTSTQGPFKVFTQNIYPELTAGSDPTSIYQMIAANDATGSVYVVIFESPKSQENELSQISNTIIKNLALNPDF